MIKFSTKDIIQLIMFKEQDKFRGFPIAPSFHERGRARVQFLKELSKKRKEDWGFLANTLTPDKR